LAAPERVFTKPGYTGISEELTNHLRELAPTEATIVGIDTDMCILKVAMAIFDLGIRPVVLVDFCASTAGLQAHLERVAKPSLRFARRRPASLAGRRGGSRGRGVATPRCRTRGPAPSQAAASHR